MSELLPRIGILASHSGSTAESVIHAIQAGILKAEVGLVVCNNPREKLEETLGDGGIYKRIDRMNQQYDLDIKVLEISGKTHPKGHIERGTQTTAESAAICEEMKLAGVGLILTLGYLKKIRADLFAEYGSLPSHRSPYQAHIINSHPGPLPETKGLYGVGVQQRVIDLGLTHSAQTLHVVTAQYDAGTVLAVHPVPVMPGENADQLFESVQLTEKTYVPVDTQAFLTTQSELGWAA